VPVDELPEVADDPPLVVAAPEPDDVPFVALLPELADPGWSRDTTTPMTTVAPAAATTTPRVRLRSRERAFSLFSGVLGWSMDDMRSEYLCWGGRPHPTIGESTPSQCPLWVCCDILPRRHRGYSAGPATI